MRESCATFLRGYEPQDVVVFYIAAHGEVEGGCAYVFGRNTPRENLEGLALEASALGAMVGGNKPHNVLLIVNDPVTSTTPASLALR